MAFWQGRTVLVTGHTGFKGSWLSWWLLRLGARVHGFALPPPTQPSLFHELALDRELESHTLADIRDFTRLAATLKAAKPDIVFHLAAQPLVGYSYINPVATYEINTLGTVHLLEAVRKAQTTRAVVNITSDKCYENREWSWPYREEDALGGHDPYSNSKACSELVTSAYRRSFFANDGIKLVTARSGNVIGGGDWAPDRLIPDFLRAVDAGREIVLRFPEAIRPWQHVLEPLSGYLALAEGLLSDTNLHFTEWNFGPDIADAQSVAYIVTLLRSRVPGARVQVAKRSHPHEAGVLRLDNTRARTELRWAPKWTLPLALDLTLEWHAAWKSKACLRALTSAQISNYENTPAR